jgi:hypothetical protein
MSANVKRSFEVIKVGSNNVNGGRYLSKTPASAAKKAGSQLSKDKEGAHNLRITIKETTRNSKKKEYTYDWSRVFEPTTVTINGKEVVYNYKTKVTAV